MLLFMKDFTVILECGGKNNIKSTLRDENVWLFGHVCNRSKYEVTKMQAKRLQTSIFRSPQ